MLVPIRIAIIIGIVRTARPSQSSRGSVSSAAEALPHGGQSVKSVAGLDPAAGLTS